MPKLFVVFLGGKLQDGRVGEDHEVVPVVAEDSHDARVRARKKWKGLDQKSVHIDSMMELSSVDGHDVSLNRVGNEEENDIRVESSYVPLS